MTGDSGGRTVKSTSARAKMLAASANSTPEYEASGN